MLAGAITQKHLQQLDRNPFLFTMELSAFSTLLLLASSLLGFSDAKSRARKFKISHGWTWKTWIPVVTNASGGILVGLVTKHAGAVRKGFALIFGMLLSGVIQNYFWSEGGRVTNEQIVGGVLAAFSLWMHSTFRL